MVLGYIITLIFCIIVLYLYIYENARFRIAVSALREIWSGACRLNCRNVCTETQVPVDNNQDKPVESQEGTTSPDLCCCETCPCVMIEYIMKSCYQITNLYTNTVDNICHNYFYFVDAYSTPSTAVSSIFTRSQINIKSKLKSLTTIAKIKSELKQLSQQPSQISRQLSTNQRNMSVDALDLETLPKSVLSDKDGCRLCVEKGKVCIKGCPKAKQD